jgi:hypothetical protein
MTLTRFSNMTADHYRRLLDATGLTQVSAGRFFGYDERTARRWATGELPVPIAVAYLLELMEAFDLTPDAVRKIADG